MMIMMIIIMIIIIYINIVIIVIIMMIVIVFMADVVLMEHDEVGLVSASKGTKMDEICGVSCREMRCCSFGRAYLGSDS